MIPPYRSSGHGLTHILFNALITFYHPTPQEADSGRELGAQVLADGERRAAAGAAPALGAARVRQLPARARAHTARDAAAEGNRNSE